MVRSILIARLIGLAATAAVAVAVADCHSPGARTVTPVAAPATESASVVLRAMADKYAHATTYKDTGTLTTTDQTDGEQASPPSHIRFTTSFDRAMGGFAFAFVHTHARFFPPRRSAIWGTWAGGFSVAARSEPPEREADVGTAIETFAGISLNTSRLVPQQLFGSEWRYRHLRFKSDGEESVGDVPCARLSAPHASGVVVIWVSKEDHSVRKFFERRRVDAASMKETLASLPEAERARAEGMQQRPFTAETTTEYHPVFDRPIDPSRFDAPTEATWVSLSVGPNADPPNAAEPAQ